MKTWTIIEGNLERITQVLTASDRIDVSGDADRRLTDIAGELDAIADRLARATRDPNSRTNVPDEQKLSQAWKLVLVAMKGRR